MNLRALAKGMDCQIRLPCCNHNAETTVLAHYRSIGLGAGIGIKPADWLGAWACGACHDAVDGRAKVEGHYYGQIRLAHAEGVLRTIAELIKRGYFGNRQ